MDDAGADVGTFRELARHADIRTTTICTAVSDARLEHAIAERARQRRGVRRAPRATDSRCPTCVGDHCHFTCAATANSPSPDTEAVSRRV
jgi:bacterioferritin-associated ferredoxin